MKFYHRGASYYYGTLLAASRFTLEGSQSTEGVEGGLKITEGDGGEREVMGQRMELITRVREG